MFISRTLVRLGYSKEFALTDETLLSELANREVLISETSLRGKSTLSCGWQDHHPIGSSGRISIVYDSDSHFCTYDVSIARGSREFFKDVVMKLIDTIDRGVRNRLSGDFTAEVMERLLLDYVTFVGLSRKAGRVRKFAKNA